MQKIDSLSHFQQLEGIYSIKLDSKNRIQIPKNWQPFFWENEPLVLLYTGEYGILITKKELANFAPKSELIVHTKHIDMGYRFLISANFLKVHGIIREENIFLVGKWNHIEVYFSSKDLENTKIRSMQSAIALQVELIRSNI